MTAQRWPEDLGSVAEEATRLLESLRRAGADSDRGFTPSPTTGPAPTDPGEGSVDGDPAAEFHCEDPVCQWCPLCRASALVRRLSPETLTGLAELAGFAASVLADLASARAREESPRAAGQHPGDQDPVPDGNRV